MSLRPIVPLAVLVVLAACETPAEPQGSCLGPQAIAATASVTGVAYTDDCDGPSGSFGDVYALTLTEQSQILITMTPTGFKPQLVLAAGRYDSLATARLVFDVVGDGMIGGKAYLPPGNYFIVAGSGESSGGDYALNLSPTSSTPCSDAILNWTVRGADIPGVVVNADCPAALTSMRQQSYGLWATPGEVFNVGIDMNKAGALLWRRQGNAAGASLAELNVSAGVTLNTAFTAPDANDAFGIHVLASPPVAGPATFTLRIR